MIFGVNYEKQRGQDCVRPMGGYILRGGGSLYLFIYESVLLIYDHFGEVKIPNVTSLCHTKGHLWP